VAKTTATTGGRLWRCPDCGRGFANRNQSHFCGKHSLDAHFDGKDANVRKLFQAFLALLRRFGPVTVLPEKTRIAFQVRMSFAALSVRRSYLIGHFVMARRLEHPRFLGVQTISPRNHVHRFRLQQLAELDEEFSDWAREAYAVGQQKHLPGTRKRRTQGEGNGERRDEQG
jgi:Domain of unknown function (DUF5655)